MQGTALLALCALGVLGLGLALFSQGMRRFRTHAEDLRKASLQEKMSLVRHALEPILEDLRTGQVGRAAALERARAQVRTFRYDDESGDNYVFMNQMDGTVLVRPQRPQDEGTRNFQVPGPAGPSGLPWEILARLREHPEGVFERYDWPNPRLGRSEEKLSFIVRIPELDVMIGTGAHPREAARAQVAVLRQALWGYLGLTGLLALTFGVLLHSLRTRNRRLAREVEERARAEASLRESERKVRAIFDLSFSLMGLLDTEGRVLDANRTALEMAGLTLEEVQGRLLWETPWWRHSEEARKTLRAAVAKAAQGEPVRVETTNVGPGGQVRTIDFSLRPVRDEGGRVVLLIPEGRDISDHREAETNLRQSHAQLATLFQASPDSILVFRVRDRVLVDVNARFQDVLGQPRDALVGRTLDDLGLGLDQAWMAGFIQAVGAQGRVESIEGTYQVPGRAPRRILASGRAVSQQGEACILALVRDITDWVSAREEANAARKRLEILVAQMPLAVIEWDQDFRALSWNPAAERIFGFTQEEALGRIGSELFAADSFQHLAPEHWREAIVSGGPTQGIHPCWRKDGTPIQCEWFNTPMMDADGRCIAVASVVQDITEAEAARRALVQSEERFQKLFDESPFMMVVSDWETGRFVAVNQAYCQRTGRSKEEILGRPQGEATLFGPDLEVRTQLASELARRGRVEEETVTYRTAGGEVRTAVLTSHLVEIAGRRHALCVLDDITERLQTERDLKLVVDNVPCAIYQCEPVAPWRIRMCSEGLARLTGRPLASFLQEGLTLADLIHPKDLPQVTRTVEEALAGDRPYEITYRLQEADGEYRWVLDRGRITRVPGTGDLRMDGVLLDIQAQKAAELNLQAQEEQLRLVIGATGVAMMDWHIPAGRWAYSDRWVALLGHPLDQLPQSIEAWERLIHPHDLPAVRLGIQAHLEGRTPSFDHEHRLRRADGGWCWVHVLAGVVARDGEGRPLRFLGTAMDISARRLAQEALEASQATFSAIFRQSQAALALSGWPEDNFLEVNEAWEDLTGYSRSEILGRTPESLGLFIPAEARQWAHDQLSAEGRVHNLEFTIRRKNGQERSILWSARIFDIGGVLRRVGSAVDITDARRITDALRESERRLRTLFEGSPIGVFRSTPEGRLLQVNPALAGMFRYDDPADMLTRVNQIGIPDGLNEHPEQRLALVGDLMGHPGTWKVAEVHFRRKDGSFMDGIMSTTIQSDPDSGQHLLIGFVQDLSERKRSEQAVLEAERRLRDIVEGSPIGIFHATPEGQYLQMNRALAEMFGYPGPDAMMAQVNPQGIPQALYEHPEQRQRMIRELEADPGGWRVEEVRLRRADGTFLDGIMSVSLLVDAATGQTTLFGFVQDISALKGAEREVQRLKNDLANIIDSMPAMLVGLDGEGRITQWNRQAEVDTGIAAGQALGASFRELLPDFSPRIEALRVEVHRHGRSRVAEKILLERNGERHLYDLMLYPLVQDRIEGAVVRIEDVTERARIQELMVQTEKMMSVGGLAAGMAHEINNPLGIISQAAQNIERRLSADLPANQAAARAAGLELAGLKAYFQARDIPAFIASIQEAVSRSTRIVGNMLQFSRRSESIVAPASLRDLLEQALELAANDYDLKKKYDFRSIEIVRDYGAEDLVVPVVAIEIEQVLLNLLKNAAQAMTDNPRSAPPRLILRISREPRFAILEVEDNGPGMEEPVRARIFEPFFTTKEPGRGTGLGLSVAYTIITQNHKGLIEVNSAPGQGARFAIRLPLQSETSHG